MEKNKRIDYALSETLKAHPNFFLTMNGTLLNQVKNGIVLNNYTTKNNARKYMLDITSADLLRYILHESIKIYNAGTAYYNLQLKNNMTEANKKNFSLMFPYMNELNRLVRKIANPNINVFQYFNTNTNDLFVLINIVLKSRFTSSKKYVQYLDKFENSSLAGINVFQKVDTDMNNLKNIELLNVKFKTVNNCFNELLSGNQLKNQRNEYALEGNLFATQDIGKNRKNQEDSAIILVHPQNDKLKFLAVADGMGGSSKGEEASSYLLQELSKWFISLPKGIDEYSVDLQNLFNRKIRELSNEIYKKYNKDTVDTKNPIAGTTFTGAIVSEKNATIISSVGDSRAYIVDQSDDLVLLTQDESVVWAQQGVPKNISKSGFYQYNQNIINDMRFNKKNSAIYRFVGDENIDNIQTYIVDTNLYKKLILLTDGVLDLTDYEKLKFFSNNAPPQLLTHYLVNNAVMNDAYRLKGEDKFYNGKIPAGKDNATAVSYVRR